MGEFLLAFVLQRVHVLPALTLAFRDWIPAAVGGERGKERARKKAVIDESESGQRRCYQREKGSGNWLCVSGCLL